MSLPSPRSLAPTEVRRKEIVAEAMLALEGVPELDLTTQIERFAQTQRLLAGVLSNDPSVTQPGLPGVPHEA